MSDTLNLLAPLLPICCFCQNLGDNFHIFEHVKSVVMIYIDTNIGFEHLKVYTKVPQHSQVLILVCVTELWICVVG